MELIIFIISLILIKLLLDDLIDFKTSIEYKRYINYKKTRIFCVYLKIICLFAINIIKYEY